ESSRSAGKSGDAYLDASLRLVDPCKLFTPETIAAVGKDSGLTSNRTGYSQCSHQVKDATTGKTISITLNLSDIIIGAPKQTGKQLAGLVVSENPSNV